MKIKVHFDNVLDGEDDAVDLTADMITLRSEAGDVFVPHAIADGHVATYELAEDKQDAFFEALDNAAWCFTGASTLDDEELTPNVGP